MTDIDRTFERLRAANPAPLTAVEDRLDAAAFLSALEDVPSTAAPTHVSRPSRIRIMAVATAAFALTLLIGAGLWMAALLSPEPDVADPPPTTVAPPTTSTTTSSSTTTTAAPTTTVAPAIDPASRLLLDRLEAAYNAGDPDAFLALLQPDLVREVVVDRDGRRYSLETVREILEIDAALHAEIALDCTANTDSFSCAPTRFDNLHRILDHPPTVGWTWIIQFDEEGLVRRWSEGRPAVFCGDDYECEVVRPFMQWVRANHPEVGELNPGTAGEWIYDRLDDITAMVDAFALSRGVDLEK